MSKNTETVLFRKAGKGYNRDDVNNYIAEMNSRFNKKETELKLRIKELEKAVESASTVTATASLDYEDLENENRHLRQQLEKVLASSEPCEPVLKADGVDGMSMKIGELLVKATLDAEKIRADAETDAENTVAVAKKQADAMLLEAKIDARVKTEQVKRRTGEISAECRQKLTDAAGDAIKKFRNEADELCRSLDGAAESAKSYLK